MKADNREQKENRDNRPGMEGGGSSDAGQFPDVMFLMHPTGAYTDAVFENCEEEIW